MNSNKGLVVALFFMLGIHSIIGMEGPAAAAAAIDPRVAGSTIRVVTCNVLNPGSYIKYAKANDYTNKLFYYVMPHKRRADLFEQWIRGLHNGASAPDVLCFNEMPYRDTYTVQDDGGYICVPGIKPNPKRSAYFSSIKSYSNRFYTDLRKVYDPAHTKYLNDPNNPTFGVCVVINPARYLLVNGSDSWYSLGATANSSPYMACTCVLQSKIDLNQRIGLIAVHVPQRGLPDLKRTLDGIMNDPRYLGITSWIMCGDFNVSGNTPAAVRGMLSSLGISDWNYENAPAMSASGNLERLDYVAYKNLQLSRSEVFPQSSTQLLSHAELSDPSVKTWFSDHSGLFVEFTLSDARRRHDSSSDTKGSDVKDKA